MDVTTSSRLLQRVHHSRADRGKVASLLLLLVVCLLQHLLLLGVAYSTPTIDELALHNFRSNVVTDPNNALGSWHQSVGACHWNHVSCNTNNRVIRLDLSNQGLVGGISASLGALEFLEYLNLENNSFTGVIPVNLGHLTRLKKLNLGNNNLNGPLPDSVQMMKDMHATNISTDSLETEICLEMVSLPQIATLDAVNNNFSRNAPKATKFKFRSIRSRFLQEHISPASGGNNKSNLPLILGVLGGVTGLLLLCISVFFVWKCFVKTQDDSKSSALAPPKVPLLPLVSSKRSAISEKARSSTRSFSIEELKTATGDFSEENVIGEGGFGLVYKGTLTTGQEVAIKHAHKDAQQGVDDFYNEVELLSKVHHKYLVDLIGFCDEDGEQLLVYEFIPNGNLFEHLCGQRTPPLNWRQRVQIAICCAKALAHLHEGCTPSIIHRDIKPSNILLDNDLFAKVADFGLSKTGPVGGASHVSTGVKGTPGYLDPYYYLNWHLGAYSDVYSFGIILLQLVASKPAVDRQRQNRSSNYSLVAWSKDCLKQGLFASIVDPKLRSQGYNHEVLLLMVKLGIRCTGEEIKGRPTMKTIYKELEHALETLGSMPLVKGLPDGSSTDQSEELAPENIVILGDGLNEQFSLYSKINFDGLSWVDIKNLGEGQFDGHDEDGEHHLEVSDTQQSTTSVHISIDSPELEVAKKIK